MKEICDSIFCIWLKTSFWLIMPIRSSSMRAKECVVHKSKVEVIDNSLLYQHNSIFVEIWTIFYSFNGEQLTNRLCEEHHFWGLWSNWMYRFEGSFAYRHWKLCSEASSFSLVSLLLELVNHISVIFIGLYDHVRQRMGPISIFF